MPEIKLIMFREFEASANRPIDGYSPAPTGLLEVGRRQYMNPKWLRKLEDDRLLKIFYEGLPYLPNCIDLSGPENYQIIFMRRNPEEIKASVERAEEYLKALEEKTGKPRIPFDRGDCGFDMYKEYNEDDIEHVLGICRARRDMNVIEVGFETFLDDTEAELRWLCDMIPADIPEEKIKRALRQVNPEYRRTRCA